MNEPLRVVPQPTVSPPVAEPGMDFEGLVEAEHGPLYGSLCLITRDRAEAEDVMQEAFLKVWERWDRVREMADPTGYLYRTAMNLYRKRLRRASLVLRRAVRSRPVEPSRGGR
jgi:RNA polymerase sigma-70 factor, ECF subfamily